MFFRVQAYLYNVNTRLKGWDASETRDTKRVELK